MGRLVSRKPVEINLNSPLNGYLPIFDGDTKLWETISSSSLFDSGGLFSGSAQVLITGTTGYDNLTSSIDLLSSSFLELSASYQSNFESASFTGSFKGDGGQLYNIPFSGVTGLVQYSSSVSLQLDALEDESGSIRGNFNSFTSSYTTGSFTGSFIGDASGLTNLNKIYDGNVSASISQDNGFRVNTDVYIDGTITAKEIHTDYVTSSVLFQSGSTKFGNSNDDTHQFTGSISLASEATNFNIVGNSFGQTYLQSLNGAMVLQPGYGGVEVIGANATLNVNGAIVGNTVSGSFIGNGAGLYNIPITGVTGLNTTRIADGNATASISDGDGLRINTNTEITGTLKVTGEATIVGDLTVSGTAYYNYVTASTLLVNDNWITVTTTSSLGRFGGIKVLDYEGVNETASLAWDTLEDRWLEVVPNHDTYSSSLFIMGPRNTGSLGQEYGLTTNSIPKADDEHHIIDSNISDDGTTVSINSNTQITGSLIVSSGSATFDATLALTENSSLILNSGSNLYVYDGGIISGTFKGNGHLLTDLPYATTGSNSFFGDQTITGSLVISQNLTVLGSSSLLIVTSSQIALSSSFLSLNIFEPAERFGGIKVYDSGSLSHLATASLAWDSLRNHWVYQNASGSSYSGGMLLAGPRNTGSLGDELSLTSGRIPKSVGGDHLDNSIISESGTVITINGGTVVANAFTGSIDFSNVENTPTLVSGSSQIEITGTTGYSTFSSSLESTYLHIEGDGVYSSSAQITGNIYTPGSSFTIQDLVLGAGTTFGKITTDGSKYISVMPTYNVESARFWPNGNVTIQNGGDYVDNGFRLEVSGSARIVGDTQITGSLIVTGTVVSETTPLVSGSSQILITGTTGYSTFSSSLSSSIGELSSSVASTNLGQNNRLDSIEGVTGSYATTGSNIFVGNQTVTGSLNVSGSSSLTGSLNVIGSGTITGDLTVQGNLIAQQFIVSSSVTYLTTSFSSGSTKFGDTIDDTHQFTGSVNISGSQTLNGILGVSIGGSTELQVNQTGVTIGNISTDIHKVTGSLNISGSEAITGSLFVSSSGVAASLIGSGSGVFTVDGTSGRLFQIDDSLSGSLFSVNTAAGLPLMEGFSDNTVRIGQFGQKALFVSQSMVGFGTETPIYKADISGSLRVTNQIILSSSQLVNQNIASLASGTQTISTNATSSFTSVFYNYTLASGSNARAGQLIAVWNGNSITYTENSTTDIGTTGNVALTASLSTGNVVLSTVLPTTGWTIKSFVNLL
jgi:hypothetical protein